MTATVQQSQLECPEQLVRNIARLVVKDDSPGNRLLHLVALCGVCKRWRQELCREVLLPVAFDGADNAGVPSRQVTVTRFRKTDVAHKRATFLGASKLLTGYSDLTLSGEAVTDEVLLNISRTNGANLISVKLLGTTAVTDEGITALVSSAPLLKVFMLEDAGRGVAGTFVPAILQSCKQLESLHIEGAEGFAWQQLQQTGAWWQPLRAPAAAVDSQTAAAAATSGHAGASSSRQAPSQQQQQLAPVGSGPSSSADGASVQQHALRQRRHLRISSDASDSLSDEDEGCFSDDGSLGAASDSTSISVPAAATAALAEQLQHSSLQEEAGGSRQAGLLLQQVQQPPHQQQQEAAAEPQQLVVPQQRRSLLCHTALRRLHVRFAAVDSLVPLLERCPGLTELQLDGPALNIQAAAAACPNVKRLAFLVGSPVELDAALFYLNGMSCLRGLELEVKGMMLSTEQLRVIGMLPLRELSLDSHAYRQQPSMPRPQFSHLDNEGVKGLVDSICSRMRSDMMPLKLSLCGATALKQEAVSALLRLPMLIAIDTGGCIKLTPMDRMRLVAKVKAGQGMMDNRAGGGGSSALASLRVAHAHAL